LEQPVVKHHEITIKRIKGCASTYGTFNIQQYFLPHSQKQKRQNPGKNMWDNPFLVSPEK